jgi:predicted nucleic acid-binding protein
MKTKVILDAGPLVAFLNRRDNCHAWAVEQFGRIEPPLLTCESVLSEACFILAKARPGNDKVLELLERGVLAIRFRVNDHVEALTKLRKKYADAPMSLADACLVRMAETSPGSVVFTLDAHFRIYRKSNRQKIPCLTPSRTS